MRTSDDVGTYASALFDLATLAGVVDEVDEDVKNVVKAVRGHVELREALVDTSLPVEKKRDVLRDIFGGSVSPEALAVVTLMVERDMAGSLGDLSRAFGEIAEKERGVVVAEVTTAVELDAALREKVAQKVAAFVGHPVTLRERTDPSLIGGIRILVGGRVLDGSVSSMLDNVRSALCTAHQGGEA
ncbi:MAG: ATP synthase F1 subunit delta [Coriobacteriia bacterium]